MRSITLALPVLAAVAGLTACGGSSTTASSSAATSSPAPSSSTATGLTADAICTSYNAQINGIPAPPSPNAPADASALPAIAAWLDKVVALGNQEQAALGAAPDGGPINASFADVITTLRGIDIAAKGTDVSAYTTQYGNFAAAVQAFHTASGQANLPNCAK